MTEFVHGGVARFHPRRPTAGFTLIELLIVIALVAVLTALAMPSSNPTVAEQLRSTAQILATDLAYGRSLAVANNSRYKFTFDIQQNWYVLQHSGTNPALDTLPSSPFRRQGDPPNKQTVDFDELPRVGPTVRLVVVAASSATSSQKISEVEFQPLGQTTESRDTVIWLGAGQGAGQRYVQLFVNPVTGLATVGAVSGQGPPPELLN